MRSRVSEIDLRNLAGLRIVIGLLCFIDALRRFPYISLLYSNEGVFSNHYALFRYPFAPFSLLYSFTTAAEVRVFFAFTLAIAILYIIGFRTFWSGLALLVCHISIVNRNLYVIYGADTVLINFLVLMQFLPVGERWGIDAAQGKMFGRQSYYSTAVFLLYAQISVIYFLAAIQKNGSTWHEGLGVYYPLFQDRVVSALGVWVRTHVSMIVLEALSHLSLMIEMAGAFLVWGLIRPHLSRSIAVIILGVFNLCILSVMSLGLFQYVMIGILVALIPPVVLDRIEALISRGKAVRVEKGVSVESIRWKRGVREVGSLFLGAVFIVDMFVHNHWIVSKVNFPRIPLIDMVVDYTSYRQSWSMFAPDVPRHDYHFVCDATLDNGEHVDVITGKAPDLSGLRFGAYKWDQQIDGFSRVFFRNNGIDQLEIERWVRERRGGMTIPPGREIVHFDLWFIEDRSPRPEERNTTTPLDVTVERYMSFSL